CSSLPAPERWYPPGAGEVSRATQTAFASGAPSCGQRLSSAKNSPLTWKTTMSRPSTPNTLLPPRGISVVRATICRVIYLNLYLDLRSQLVERAGVAAKDLAPFSLRQRRLE